MGRPGRVRNISWRKRKANHGRKPCKGKIKSRFLRERFRSR